MDIDRCGNTNRQKCHTKGSRKDTKIQAFVYRDTINVGCEMYDHIGNDWSHWKSNKRLRKKFGSYTRKTFNRCIMKDSYRLFIIHTNTSKQS
jgi:hypothetical protein